MVQVVELPQVVEQPKQEQPDEQEEPQAEQRTLDWFRCRLGNITGSECGSLMQESRTKGETFGKTAKGYLYRLAAERTMNPMIVNDDDLFGQYVDWHQLRSKSVKWGTEQEENAKRLFSKLYHMKLEETGSVCHPTIEHFAASPDGIVRGLSGQPIAVVEFKSPGQEAFMRYCAEVETGEDLKKVSPLYYWQCVAEMMCVGVKICWFTVFCPWQRVPMQKTLVVLKDEDAELLEERIRLANEFIEELIAYNEL